MTKETFTATRLALDSWTLNPDGSPGERARIGRGEQFQDRYMAEVEACARNLALCNGRKEWFVQDGDGVVLEDAYEVESEDVVDYMVDAFDMSLEEAVKLVS